MLIKRSKALYLLNQVHKNPTLIVGKIHMDPSIKEGDHKYKLVWVRQSKTPIVRNRHLPLRGRSFSPF